MTQKHYGPSVLFAKEDEPLIRAAAAAAGQSVGEYIRSATMLRIAEDSMVSTIRDGVIAYVDNPADDNYLE
jgi:hypothetical protein